MASYDPATPLIDSTHELRGSWVNPNATCPVCGSPVYFYCSPDGGRVYFDELGPPWPKHPCTDGTGVAARAAVLNTKRWDKSGWQPLVDFDVSLIAGDNLYRIVGNAGPYERRLLFRLDGSCQIEMVRFNEKKGVEVELSLLARDMASGDWLVCDGVGKLAPNYPPRELLRVTERIPNAAERFVPAIERPGNGAMEPVGDLGTLPAQVPPELEQGDSSEVASPLVRVEEIDGQIRALLAEISALNDEKTRLLRAAMKTSGDSSR